jgi:hypothetical protein
MIAMCGRWARAPGKGAQVGRVSRILRRNNEAELVAIFLTSLGEGALIGGVGSGRLAEPTRR